jgi:hypothetical protein
MFYTFSRKKENLSPNISFSAQIKFLKNERSNFHNELQESNPILTF